MRDPVCMEVDRVGAAAVAAARVLRLEERSLRHIVSAVSVYERESEIEISGHALPFVVMRRALSVFRALNWYLAAKLRMN